MDTLKGQKSELSKDVEVLKVKLAELQARLSEAHSSIEQYREKEKVRARVTLECKYDVFYFYVVERMQRDSKIFIKFALVYLCSNCTNKTN